MLLPAGIVEILIEEHKGTRLQPGADMLEDGHGRAVKIAVDMDEADRTVMTFDEVGQAVFEIAMDQLGVGRHFRDVLLAERAGGFHMAGPVVRQAGEAVEAVDRGTCGGVGGNLAQGVARGHTEFHEHAARLGVRDRVFDDPLMGGEYLRFGHVFLHIIGGFGAGAQLQLIEQIA